MHIVVANPCTCISTVQSCTRCIRFILLFRCTLDIYMWCRHFLFVRAKKTALWLAGYLLDPHAAVATAVAKRYSKDHTDVPILIAGTAHYAKFARDVMMAVHGVSDNDVASMAPLSMLAQLERLGARPCAHQALRDSLARPQPHKTVLDADLSAIKREIFRCLAAWSLFRVMWCNFCDALCVTALLHRVCMWHRN